MAHPRAIRLHAIISNELAQLPDLSIKSPALERKEELAQEHADANQVQPTCNAVQLPVKIVSEQKPGHKPGMLETPSPLSEHKLVEATRPAPVVTLQSNTLGPLHLEHGEIGPVEESYCPVLELSRYCYKYIQASDSQAVASAFFDGGKFWARIWDIFYIRHPDTNHIIGLVTESQLQQFLQDINITFSQLDLTIDSWQREHGLVTRFPPSADTQPRYLGRTQSKAEYLDMMAGAPPLGFRLPDKDRLPSPDDHSLEAFKTQMDTIDQLKKAKNKAAREQRIQHTIATNKAMSQQLKRAQRYLGLLAKSGIQPLSQPENVIGAGMGLAAIDFTAAVPYPFELAPIIISIDAESYERDHSKVTEVGICTLDTLKLVGVAPGPNGANWRKFPTNRHIRIREHAHLINKDFVHGCPGKFEFGQSEIVGLKDIPELLSAAFHEATGRNIVILGHDPNQDIAYFHRLGFNPLTISLYTPTSTGLVEVLDTAALYRSYSRLDQSRKLGAILVEFDIEAWFCHNAGNDAVYTMQAMLAIAVNDAAQRGDEDVLAKKAAHIEERIRGELQIQEELKRAAVSGFGDAGSDDGGMPVPPTLRSGMADQAKKSARLSIGDQDKKDTARGQRAQQGAKYERRGRGRAVGRIYPGNAATRTSQLD